MVTEEVVMRNTTRACYAPGRHQAPGVNSLISSFCQPYKVGVTSPQSLLETLLGKICFRIQNCSDFRTEIGAYIMYYPRRLAAS